MEVKITHYDGSVITISKDDRDPKRLLMALSRIREAAEDGEEIVGENGDYRIIKKDESKTDKKVQANK